MFDRQGIRALAVSAALTLSLTGVALAQGAGDAQEISLPNGTVLKAELNYRLSSTYNQPGDRFTAVLLPSGVGLPPGTEVVGEVVDVASATQDQPGVVKVRFTDLQFPNGRIYPIAGQLIDLNASSVRETSSGRLEARGRASSTPTAFIGYGAGAGALISALTGGSLLRGALLGALGGYAYQQLSRDRDEHGSYSNVNLAPGTEVGVRLDHRAVVNVAENPYRDYGYRERTAGSFQEYINGDIRVLVDGNKVIFTLGQPFMRRDHVMVPLQPVLDATGYGFSYDPAASMGTIYGGQGDTRFTVGDRFAVVAGARMPFDNAPEQIDGVIYVSVPLLEMATGSYARWNADTRTLRLRTGVGTGY